MYGTNYDNNGTTISNVTHLLVPKQVGTSSSCHATDPAACVQFEIDTHMIQLGWIHVHPEQTCFMSGVDCHVQYQPQVDICNYVGIVYSHRDNIFGIFSISNKGFTVLSQCQVANSNNHHLHESPDVYGNATHAVYTATTTIVIDQRGLAKIVNHPLPTYVQNVMQQQPSGLSDKEFNKNKPKAQYKQSRKKISQKKQIRQRKITIKLYNKDDMTPTPAAPPKYHVSAKLRRPLLSSLISQQSQRLAHNSHLQSSNNTTNSKSLTGKAAVQAMKGDKHIRNIIKNKDSFYVTNKLVKEKESESIIQV